MNQAKQATKRPRRKQEDRTAEAKAAIRKSALELFAIQGYDMTTLSQVSTRVNFSRGLAQYHYKTKEALAEELMDSAVALHVKYHGLVETPTSKNKDIIEKLEHQIDESSKGMGILLAGENALEIKGLALLTSVATFSSNDQLRKKIQKHNHIIGSRIEEAIQKGIDEGVVRKDVDPEGFASFYIGSTWGISNELFAEPSRHDVVMKGFETLKLVIRNLRP